MEQATRQAKRSFNFRALVTLLTASAFVVMAVSGVMLYVAPRGRVANWMDWTLLGLGKAQWADIHMTAAVLLLIVMVFHVYNNWKPLCHYVKSKAKESRLRLRELGVAVGVTVAVAAGTLAEVWPLSGVLIVNERIKDAWEGTAGTVGRAPSTYVQEASVSEFAARMGISEARLREVMAERGMVVRDEDERMDEVARRHGVSLQWLYEAARGETKTARGTERGAGMEGEGNGGYGRMALAELCQLEGVSVEEVLRRLEDEGVVADEGSRVREVAEAMGMRRGRFVQWVVDGER